jgi:hypothetical protein
MPVPSHRIRDSRIRSDLRNRPDLRIRSDSRIHEIDPDSGHRNKSGLNTLTIPVRKTARGHRLFQVVHHAAGNSKVTQPQPF